MTQPEAGDPLGSQYGDTQLIQSRTQAAETYLDITSLSEEQSTQIVRSQSCHTLLSKHYLHLQGAACSHLDHGRACQDSL